MIDAKEKIWVLSKSSCSDPWPTNGSFWLLEKKDADTARRVLKDLIRAINVDGNDGDDDVNYAILASSMSLVIANMLDAGAALSVRIIDKPFAVQLPHTYIEVRFKETDQNIIENSLFYFFARLLVQWSAEVDIDKKSPSECFSQNCIEKIIELLKNYQVA